MYEYHFVMDKKTRHTIGFSRKNLILTSNISAADGLIIFSSIIGGP